MAEFKLSASVTISIYTVVEAENLDKAIDEAMCRSIETAEYFGKNQKNQVWVADEYDGEPFDVFNEE